MMEQNGVFFVLCRRNHQSAKQQHRHDRCGTSKSQFLLSKRQMNYQDFLSKPAL